MHINDVEIGKEYITLTDLPSVGRYGFSTFVAIGRCGGVPVKEAKSGGVKCIQAGRAYMIDGKRVAPSVIVRVDPDRRLPIQYVMAYRLNCYTQIDRDCETVYKISTHTDFFEFVEPFLLDPDHIVPFDSITPQQRRSMARYLARGKAMEAHDYIRARLERAAGTALMQEGFDADLLKADPLVIVVKLLRQPALSVITTILAQQDNEISKALALELAKHAEPEEDQNP